MTNLFISLVKIANSLDAKGLHKEADTIDQILKTATRNALFAAIKSGDAAAAKSALVGMSGEDFGMTHHEFRNLAQMILEADKLINEDEKNLMIQDIGKLLGVDTHKSPNVDTLDPNVYNPVTGQPWTSGTVQQTQESQESELRQYLRSLFGTLKTLGGKKYQMTSTSDTLDIDVSIPHTYSNDELKTMVNIGLSKIDDKKVGPVDIDVTAMDADNMMGIYIAKGPYGQSIRKYVGDLLNILD